MKEGKFYELVHLFISHYLLNIEMPQDGRVCFECAMYTSDLVHFLSSLFFEVLVWSLPNCI